MGENFGEINSFTGSKFDLSKQNAHAKDSYAPLLLFIFYFFDKQRNFIKGRMSVHQDSMNPKQLWVKQIE